jgi:hypothetical protein
MLKWLFRSKPTIEFFCAAEHFGAIAKPVPAGKVLPEWYRNIQPVDPTVASVQDAGTTVKRCMPFLEALSQGWIIPTPVELRVKLSEDGQTISTHNNYPRTLITPHFQHQVRGSPMENKAIIKFETLWYVKTPPGWSCLMTQPLNRPSDFVVLSGVLDTDMYHQVVMPFYFTRPDGLFVLKKGTPLVQVIPFKREVLGSDIRAATTADATGAVVDSNAVFSEKGWYRKHVWSRR